MRVEKDNIIVVRSPVTDLKAIKNEVEVEDRADKGANREHKDCADEDEDHENESESEDEAATALLRRYRGMPPLRLRGGAGTESEGSQSMSLDESLGGNEGYEEEEEDDDDDHAC